jgi:hypothetical protein
MADGIFYTHEEFIGLLMDTMERQLTVTRSIDSCNERAEQCALCCALSSPTLPKQLAS